MVLPSVTALHCVSNFSFLRGASFPEELVGEALRQGYAGLAITDECSLAGVVRAWKAVREAGEAAAGFRLLIGSEFTTDDDLRLVLLACNRRGYGQLSSLISRAREDSAKGRYHLSRAMLETQALDDCLTLWVPPGGRYGSPALRTLCEEQLQWLCPLFRGRLWIAASRCLDGQDREKMQLLEALGTRADVPLCAAPEVLMHQRRRRRLRDTLTAIRLGLEVSRVGLAGPGNAEQYLWPRRRLAALYPSALLEETGRIARRCDFTLEELRYEYPRELVPFGHTPQSWLRELARQGMRERWPDGVPDIVRTLVARELALIAELGYEPFFLTVKDIVDFARSRDILCQGRGSAANSALCYCLGITAVDPSRMQLLFERFISKERNEPPDIDVDFEHERREEVIQYIYRKYGRDHAALAATVICYRRRSALRDVGKALGLGADLIEALLEVVRAGEDGWLRPDPEQAEALPLGPWQWSLLMDLVNTLIGFPRHLSQHVGGFVISDCPLAQLVPVENASMPDRTVIQWEKDDLEALGLLKVDVLSLGMLTAIRKALTLVSGLRGRLLALADVPADDPAVYEMISQADTVGVFQIESRAQMSMLPRLQPRCYYDLVIQIAIVRPGPIQGDMVHPYLARRQGREPVEYPGPEVESVLKRTLGVPIFQEQVMQIAIVAAGFSGGEADQLRRAMAAWKKKGGLEPFRERLIEGMRARGYEEAFALQIYHQIRGFGEYGFPESHSASFALLAYVSSWLKCHYPAAFTCALLNSQPMGFYAPSQLVQDARRHDVEVRPVDVNASAVDCTLERGSGGSPALRLGLRMISGLPRSVAQRLVEQRQDKPYGSIAEAVRRAGLDERARDSLAAADAFAALAGDRHRAFWMAAGVEPVPPLFEADVDHYGQDHDDVALMLPRAGEACDVIADYHSTGLSLRRHPLALLRHRLQQAGVVTAQALTALQDGAAVRVAGLITCRQRPGTASGVTFLTLEDESGFTNVVVWASVLQQQRREVEHAGMVLVLGHLQKSDGVIHVIARRFRDLDPLLAGLRTASRDFC
ncbi:MAG: error-prone DNA polymerase [Pseudohongiellaceae bacterium]